jgi:hypothetical protein
MTRDVGDVCTWREVLVSELFAALARLVARPGAASACTDAEVMTMALVGEWCG